MDQIKTGRLLQDLRKEHGFTQEQLAERLFVSRRTVSRWETGSNLPDLDILMELSDLYAVPLRELLDGERKSEKMDKELEETVIKVAEYSSEEKKRSALIARVYFIIGIIALLANGIMNMMELGDTFAVGLLKGLTFGTVLASMILGIIYTTGLMCKLYAFKKRLLRRGRA